MGIKKLPSILNIAIVGGGADCKEFLEKSTLDYSEGGVNARILAVADSSPDEPGMILARQIGLKTVEDYHDLYTPVFDIHMIAILTPDQSILEDILDTKPDHIRLLSYPAYKLFKEAIGVEERKLKKRNEEVETILNSIQDFIVVISPDLEILEVNDAFLDKMGYRPEEVIGRKCHTIFQNQDKRCAFESLVCPLEEVINSRKPRRQVLKRLNKEGGYRYIEVSTFPVWEKTGRISKFIEISRDITKSKMEEEEITRRLELMVEERTRQLEETLDKLLHQDKMASLGKLSAAVVHEINNPVAGVLNLTILMKRIIEEGEIQGQMTEQFHQYLELMETETRRISRIISNLLAFSRQSVMEFRQFDLNALIDMTLLLNANLIKIHGVRVEKSLNSMIPVITGSEDQLQQVFMNFISNAVESLAGPGGGTLHIKTDPGPDKGSVTIRIQDNGIGIPEENIPRLFEPFFTTKKKGKGVGLGLSVVYGIIKEHGGTIRVESEVGKGTVFTIFLPVRITPDVGVKTVAKTA